MNPAPVDPPLTPIAFVSSNADAGRQMPSLHVFTFTHFSVGPRGLSPVRRRLPTPADAFRRKRPNHVRSSSICWAHCKRRQTRGNCRRVVRALYGPGVIPYFRAGTASGVKADGHGELCCAAAVCGRRPMREVRPGVQVFKRGAVEDLMAALSKNAYQLRLDGPLGNRFFPRFRKTNRRPTCDSPQRQ